MLPVNRALSPPSTRLGASASQLLHAGVAAYILAALLASELPSLSKLVHLSIVLCGVAVLFKAVGSGLVLRKEPLVLTSWVFFAFAGTSIFWSTEQAGAATTLASLFTDLLGMSVLWIAFWNGVSIRFVAYTAGGAGLVQALLSLGQWIAGGASTRAVGLADNPNTLAVQLTITGFLLLLAAHHGRWGKVVAATLIIVATVVTGSRKMLFVWLVLALLAIRHLKVKLTSSALSLGLFLLLLPAVVLGLIRYGDTLLAPAADLSVYQRVVRAVEGTDASARVRVAMVNDALDLWTEAPLVGHGLDQFRYLNRFNTYSHNNYTELLVDLGLVGFVIYYSMIVMIMARAGEAVLQNRTGGIYVLVGCLLLLLWDLALVSHMSRMVWIFVAVLAYASSDSGLREIESSQP